LHLTPHQYLHRLQPQLLSIFEKYYFRLGPDLKPAMRGLVIALLPVVEEEGSEFFDKVGCAENNNFICIWR
jgi:Dopey, N-terminal